MTARVTIARESIIAAAIEIIRGGGWEAVSARGLASRLSASTMPIYTAIGSMEALRTAVAERAASLLLGYQLKPRGKNQALGMAIGYVAFAREEPRLFRFAIGAIGVPGKTKPGTPEEAMGLTRGTGASEVPGIKRVLETLADPVTRSDFVLRSWIFTHGLAELIASGVFSMDDAEIRRHLEAAGGAFYRLEMEKGEA